jgi:hypothetical protein
LELALHQRMLQAAEKISHVNFPEFFEIFKGDFTAGWEKKKQIFGNMFGRSTTDNQQKHGEYKDFDSACAPGTGHVYSGGEGGIRTLGSKDQISPHIRTHDNRINTGFFEMRDWLGMG